LINNKSHIVKTKSGQIEGVHEQDIYIFKGVPYAAPPVGDLRWLPPQPVEPWKGVRQAKTYGPIAPQNEGKFNLFRDFIVEGSQSEDCLYLNIWTQGLDNLRRPVMVWFHGGAFALGSGSHPQFSGDILAGRSNAVIVTINYRLGLLGFLNLNEVTGGKIPSSGNEGLLDQIAALSWVRDNIAAFGGNPDNVTLFGESAGAMSIGCLMAMPRAKGLFHKTILQSGAANQAKSLNSAVQHAQLFLETVKLKADDVTGLRSLTVKQILSVQQLLETKLPAMTLTSPVIDGDNMADLPLKLIRSGSASDIPLLTGTNLDEWKLFNLLSPALQKMDEARLLKLCQRMVPSGNAEDLIKIYRQSLIKRGQTISPLELFSAIKTDYEFRIPAILLAEAQGNHNCPVYFYLFNWKSPAMDGMMGSCHSLDVGFVFGHRYEEFCGSVPLADQLSSKMQDAWLAFAKTGNPGCDSLGNWPAYGLERETMVLGENCYIEKSPYDAERKVWGLFPEAFNK
jgi:para-nitrobenzyl esterase